MKTSQRFIVYVVGVLLGLLAFAVTRSWPPHNSLVHVLLALLLVVLYIWAVLGIIKRNMLDQDRLLPGEVLKWRIRLHPIALIPTALCYAFAALSAVVALITWSDHKVIGFSAPSAGKPPSRSTTEVSPLHVVMHHHSFVVWYIPAVVAIVFIILALLLMELWRCTWWTLTNRRLIEQRNLSPVVLFLLRRKFDAQQLNQVVDVDDDTGFWGDRFNWGTIKMLVRTVITSDRDEAKTLRLIPSYREFADDIRLGSPITHPPSRHIPTDPIDIPPSS